MKNLIFLCLLSGLLASGSCLKEEECGEEGYVNVPIEQSLSDTLNKYGFLWKKEGEIPDDVPPSKFAEDEVLIINSENEYNKVGTIVYLYNEEKLINQKKPKIDFKKYTLLVAKTRVGSIGNRKIKQGVKRRCYTEFIYEISSVSEGIMLMIGWHYTFAVIPKTNAQSKIILQRQDFK